MPLSLSAPLAQCVSHRSSNQVRISPRIRYSFFFVIIISFFSFFIRFYSSFLWSLFSSTVLAITGRPRQMNVALSNIEF